MTGLRPHTLPHDRVQWVANPLSGHVYFVLITRVDQVRDPALHRIELKTSRSIAQRLAPLHYVGYVLSPQIRANILKSSMFGQGLRIDRRAGWRRSKK